VRRVARCRGKIWRRAVLHASFMAVILTCDWLSKMERPDFWTTFEKNAPGLDLSKWHRISRSVRRIQFEIISSMSRGRDHGARSRWQRERKSCLISGRRANRRCHQYRERAGWHTWRASPARQAHEHVRFGLLASSGSAAEARSIVNVARPEFRRRLHGSVNVCPSGCTSLARRFARHWPRARWQVLPQ